MTDSYSARAPWAKGGLSLLRQLLALDSVLEGTGAFDSAMAGQIRAAQVSAVARYPRAVTAGTIANAIIIIMAFLATPMAGSALIWGFFVIFYATFIYLRARTRKGKSPPRYVENRAIWRAVTHAAVMGSLWAAPALLLFNTSPADQMLIACLGTGMICVGCFVLATIPLAVLAFVTPIAVATGIGLTRGGEFGHYMIALMLLSYIGVLFAAVFSHAIQFLARVKGQLEAEREARRDALTALPNRTAFLEALDRAVARYRRYGEGFALLSMDLDGFKAVNDRFGHPVGDQLLLQVGARLAASVRDRDTLARISGDEFMLLMPGVNHPDRAAGVADRLLASFAAPIVVGDDTMPVRLSIGVSLAPADGTDPAELLEHADSALYQVKRQGKNAYRLFSHEDDAQARKRKSWSLDLRKAIARGEMHLVFQPIYRIGAGRVTGFEALLRWTHPEHGAIPPSDFIALAERSGMIHELGDWVIAEACRAASAWPHDVKVSVNFSLDQFRSEAIVKTILDSLARYRLDPSRFEIEVTESVLLEDEPVIEATLHALKRAGMRVVLDDFGTGFSSLRHLQEIPIDGFKVDRSFTRGLCANSRSLEIVRAVVQLGLALGLSVTAEGVETAEQMAILRALGCHHAQGFYLGRPVLEADARALCAGSDEAGRLVA